MIEQGVLTKYIDGDCTVNWTWNPIVCNTAVCHTISSVDIYNMPGISNKQHLILWHSVSIIIFGAGLAVALQNPHSQSGYYNMTSSLVELKGKNMTM